MNRLLFASLLSVLLLGCSSGENRKDQQTEIPEPPQQKQEMPIVDYSEKIDRLVTFSRVSGAIQFYYPGDGAAATDWDRFNVYGFYRIATTESEADFVATMRELFSEVAPDVAFDDDNFAMPVFEQSESVKSVSYDGYMDTYEDTRDTGYDIYHNVSSYSDAMQFRSTNVFSKDYGNISLEMPLVLKSENSQTIPAGSSFSDSTDWLLPTTLSNPYACMTVASKAWNGIQHFWPYFDTINVNWEAELPELLSSCNSESDKEKLDQLSRSLTMLEDNHIGYSLNKYYQTYPYYTVPLGFDWSENKPVVITKLNSAPEKINFADELVAVDDVPVADLVEHYEPFTLKSAAKRKHRVFTLMLSRNQGELIKLDLRDSEGAVYRLELEATATINQLYYPTRDTYTQFTTEITREIPNGLLYVNGYKILDSDLSNVVDKMQLASGVILDLRNYPESFASWELLSFLTSNDISAPPLYKHWTYAPDRTEISRQFLPQHIPAQQPSIDAPIVVLSSRYSQSQNEHLLAYIQNAGVQIIGEPTSGINGTFTELHVFPHDEDNAFRLLFTGMEVTQNDGTPLIGVGILPDIFIERSIESIRNQTDNQLEAAIEYLQQQISQQ